LSSPLNRSIMVDRASTWGVTAAPDVNTIMYVRSLLERKLLTKRRAVDFGRLSSAICMPGRPASA